MENLIMGLTLFQFAYYFCWALFGQIFSFAIQQVKYAPKIKADGGFSLWYWIKDNFWRGVVTLCAIIAGTAFTEQLLGIELTEFTAFLAGFATDKVVDALMNRKK